MPAIADIQRAAEVCDQLGELLDSYGIFNVCLFGSRARGDHQARSDWDILLECSRPLTCAEYWHLKACFLALMGDCSLASPQYASDFFVRCVEPDCIAIWR